MADWWRCPNDPPCAHPGLTHDIHDFDDPRPICCTEGCDCGRPVPSGLSHSSKDASTERPTDG